MNDYNDLGITNEDGFIDEQQRYEEYRVVEENRYGPEYNEQPSEFGDLDGKMQSLRKKPKYDDYQQKTPDHSNIYQMMSTVAVVAIVATAVVVSDSPFSEEFAPFTGIVSDVFGVDVNPYEGYYTFSCIAGAGVIWYDVQFEEFPSDRTVRVEAHNSFTERSVTLTASGSGEFADLKAGSEYTVTLVIGGKTMESETVTIPEQYYEYPTLDLYYAECKCMKDGMFHFRFDLTDRCGVCSGIEAKLVYHDGSFTSCVISDVTSEQTVEVDLDHVSEKTAKLIISADVQKEDGTVSHDVLCEEDVMI